MTLGDFLHAAVEMVAIQAAIILPLGFVAHAWRVNGDAQPGVKAGVGDPQLSSRPACLP